MREGRKKTEAQTPGVGREGLAGTKMETILKWLTPILSIGLIRD